jgi:hypothetical protein
MVSNEPCHQYSHSNSFRKFKGSRLDHGSRHQFWGCVFNQATENDFWAPWHLHDEALEYIGPVITSLTYVSMRQVTQKQPIAR